MFWWGKTVLVSSPSCFVLYRRGGLRSVNKHFLGKYYATKIWYCIKKKNSKNTNYMFCTDSKTLSNVVLFVCLAGFLWVEFSLYLSIFQTQPDRNLMSGAYDAGQYRTQTRWPILIQTDFPLIFVIKNFSPTSCH